MTLTVQDFDNGARDLKTVSAVANSRDPDTGSEISTYPTRGGDISDTLQGKLDKLGVIYSDPIKDWASSLTVNQLEAHRYPASTGDVYIPIAPLPFTTGAIFDTNNWILARDFSDSQVEGKIKEVTPTLTDLVFATVTDMKANPNSLGVVLTEGMTVSTGATTWKVVSASGTDREALPNSLYAIPLNGLWVDDYIEDRSVNANTGFTSALALNRKLRLTEGDYYINDIPLTNGVNISGPKASIVQCDTAGAACFLADTSLSDVTKVHLKGFTARAAGSLAGCAFVRQTDKTFYLSYPKFENIDTWKNFQITYDGFFIFGKFSDLRDGFSGTNPVGQTHQAINSTPAAFGQARQTNLNNLERCYFFNADNPDGCVDIAYGGAWSFSACDFEALSTRAIRARGVYGIEINGQTWFENIAASEMILIDVSPAPNSQGTRPVNIDGVQLVCGSTTTRFITVGNSSTYNLKNAAFVQVPSGFEVSNKEPIESEACTAISGAGAASLLANFRSVRPNMEFTSNIINSPQTQNQNALPIGPSALGAANLTSSGFTGVADVPSELGLGDAVSVTVSGSGGIIYYALTPKLRNFLAGRVLTLVVSGTGDGGTAVIGQAAVWDSVTPSVSNATSIGSGINATTTDLQVGRVSFTVTSGVTSLAVGLRAGGVAGNPKISIEAMSLVLGEVKSDFMTLI